MPTASACLPGVSSRTVSPTATSSVVGEVLAEHDAVHLVVRRGAMRVEAARRASRCAMSVTVGSSAGIDALSRDERLLVARARQQRLAQDAGRRADDVRHRLQLRDSRRA